MTMIETYQLECPNCNTVSEKQIYHTINSSEIDAGKRIINDEINFVVCGTCGAKSPVLTPLLYVNHQYQFALWYWPNGLSSSAPESSEKNHGGATFIFNPIIFRDWNEFKNKIRELECI